MNVSGDGSYNAFADVYDELMDGVPYEAWCDRIVGTLRDHGIEDGLILDLCCGTGTMTGLLAQAGFDMIGADHSPEMLQVAEKKRAVSGHEILYLCQDMRDFELYGTVRAVVCICDSINYITDPEELKEVFRLVDNYLDPGGIFIFDFNTLHKYRDVIGDATIAENRENVSFIWENYWLEEEKVNEYDLTLFIREGEHYRKCTETHYQRGYEASEIEAAIAASGLRLLEMKDADTGKVPGKNTERILVTAQECRKKHFPDHAHAVYLFDLDGVLLDTEPLYRRFWMEAVRKCGYEMKEEEALALRSLDAGLAREWFRNRYGADLYDEIRETRKSLMEEYRKQTPVQAKPGAAKLLTELEKDDTRYYIVTASPLSRVERYAKDAGLYIDPEKVISTKTVSRGKPYPDVYLEALKIAGCEAKDAVAVEDSPNGIRSAKEAGCYTIMIPDLTQPTKEDLGYCDRVCTSLADLPASCGSRPYHV